MVTYTYSYQLEPKQDSTIVSGVKLLLTVCPDIVPLNSLPDENIKLKVFVAKLNMTEIADFVLREVKIISVKQGKPW